MHDAYAAHAPMPAMPEEIRNADRRRVAVHAVQVELIFDHPVAAAELPQHVAAQSFAEVGECLAGVQGVVGTDRLSCWSRTLGVNVLATMSDRLGVRDRLAEVVVLRH